MTSRFRWPMPDDRNDPESSDRPSGIGHRREVIPGLFFSLIPIGHVRQTGSRIALIGSERGRPTTRPGQPLGRSRPGRAGTGPRRSARRGRPADGLRHPFSARSDPPGFDFPGFDPGTAGVGIGRASPGCYVRAPGPDDG